MKTLYVNISNEQIQSNEELEVLKHDLDGDFFFYLGEKIAKGCKVENENALVTDFNTSDNTEDFKQIIDQWKKIKTILLSEECCGRYEFILPSGYIRWMRFNPLYIQVYYKNFSHNESVVLSIDLKELYAVSIGELLGEILNCLKRDDQYMLVDKIVINDDMITLNSQLIIALKSQYPHLSIETKSIEIEKEEAIVDVIEDIDTKEESSLEECMYEDDDTQLDVSISKQIALCLKYEFIDDVCDGLARVQNRNSEWGFINTKGEEVIPCIYDNVSNFSDGLACVSLNMKYGYINKHGDIVIPLVYNSAYRSIDCFEFSEDLALAYLNDGYGYINKEGIGVISCIYENALPFSDGLASVELNNKWGFINHNGEVVIPFLYDDVPWGTDPSFYEGLASVRLNGKSGCINKEGELIIPFIYRGDIHFHNGLAATYNDQHKCGVIDKTGQAVIPFIYEFIEIMNDEYYIVKLNGKYGLVDRSGKAIVPTIYDGINLGEGIAHICYSDKYGVMSYDGKEIIPCTRAKYNYDYNKFLNLIIAIDEDDENKGYLLRVNGQDRIDYQFYADGLICIAFKGKHGVINIDGEEIIPCIYKELEYIETLQTICATDYRNNRYYYDNQGNTKEVDRTFEDKIIAAKLSQYSVETEILSEGLAIVTNMDNKMGVIDNRCQPIIPFYDEVNCIHALSYAEFYNINNNQVGWFTIRNGDKQGYIDRTGREMLLGHYEHCGLFNHGFSEVVDNMGYHGLIDMKGNEVIPCHYEDFMIFNKYDEGIFCAKIHGRYGFIDISGNTRIPFKYERPHCFYEGLAWVMENNKYGCIDTNGNVILPFKYDHGWYFHNGMCIAKVKGKMGVIDKQGNQIIPFQYCDVHIDFANELFAVGKYGFLSRNPKYGFVDKTNKTIIPLKYDDVKLFSEELAAVAINNKYGYINIKDELIIPIKYDYAGDFVGGLAEVGCGNKRGVIDQNGKVIIPINYDYIIIYKLFNIIEAINTVNQRRDYYNKHGDLIFTCAYIERPPQTRYI